MSDITDRLQECADHFPVIEDNPYSVFVDAKNEITSLRQQLEQAQGGQEVGPVALLRREIGESSWFDHTPVRPNTAEAEGLKASTVMDYCEVYTRPQPTQQWVPSGIDYDRAIHHNPDAKAWADLFMQTFPHCGADPETMHGWFANAMMAMYDHLKSNQSAQQSNQEDVIALLTNALANIRDTDASAKTLQSMAALALRGAKEICDE